MPRKSKEVKNSKGGLDNRLSENSLTVLLLINLGIFAAWFSLIESANKPPATNILNILTIISLALNVFFILFFVVFSNQDEKGKKNLAIVVFILTIIAFVSLLSLTYVINLTLLHSPIGTVTIPIFFAIPVFIGIGILLRRLWDSRKKSLLNKILFYIVLVICILVIGDLIIALINTIDPSLLPSWCTNLFSWLIILGILGLLNPEITTTYEFGGTGS